MLQIINRDLYAIMNFTAYKFSLLKYYLVMVLRSFYVKIPKNMSVVLTIDNKKRII